MGKFYDAMQRVSRSEENRPKEPKPSESRLPELDESLLQPEGAGGAPRVGSGDDDSPLSFETAILKTSQGVPGLNQLTTDLDIEKSDEPVLKVVDSQSQSPLSATERQSAFPAPMRRLRTDVFRRPIEAAYERIIQKLFAYRRTPRESVILVTSAVAGEGKSTVARNIAFALAQHRAERVLLIDANLRSPSQHRFFGIENPEGLGDVLLGPKVLTSVIQDEVAPGLSLLPSGRANASPAQLLTVASLQSVIMALLSLYDWVIIDSPPATAFPDVATIASACGGAILVVEAEKTRQEVVEEAKRVLNISGVDLLGAVLNRRRYHIPGFIYERL